MSTFNEKHQHQNIIAVLLGIVGILLLGITWLYHMLVQVVTMPVNDWINPLDRTHWRIKLDYPNRFCKCFCNIEATMINQLYELRVGFGTEYCKEEETS